MHKFSTFRSKKFLQEDNIYETVSELQRNSGMLPILTSPLGAPVAHKFAVESFKLSLFPANWGSWKESTATLH